MVQKTFIQVVVGQPQMQQFVYYKDLEDRFCVRKKRKGSKRIWKLQEKKMWSSRKVYKWLWQRRENELHPKSMMEKG